MMDMRNIKAREMILFMFSVIAQGVSVQGCRSEAFPPTDLFLVGENVHYLVPNNTHKFGHLVLVPEMRFNCHGYITGWSALVQLDSNDDAITHLYHDITFQLWRPSSRDSDVFSFVGSQTIALVGDSIRRGLVVGNGIQYLNFTSATHDPGERLVFQPGDVIGWYIHTLVQSIQHPLSVVYRHLSTSSGTTDSRLRPIDMYTKTIADTSKADTMPPCQVSLCSDELTLIPSVIPYVTVDIEVLSGTSSTQSDGIARCVNTTLDLNSCNPNIRETTVTVDNTNPPSTGTPPTIPPTDDNGNNSTSIALTTGIVASLVVFALVFNIIVTSLIVYVRSKRSKGQSPHGGANQGNMMDDESRYSTHSDTKELNTMTSGAYTTDIHTKRNEAYGAPVAATSGMSVVKYYV